MQRVVEASEWFIRTPSVRMLHIVTNRALRLAVLEYVTATELLEVNTWPFFVLEAPTELDDDGWTLRSEELRADWAGLVDAATASARVLDPLWPEHVAPDAIERFCLELHSALGSRDASMSGLVIVLAPVWVRDGARWRRDLSALLEPTQLREARFVIVECDDPHGLAVAEQLGPAADIVDARVCAESLRNEMRARVEAMIAAPAGATGPRLTGAAGPTIAPPSREGAPTSSAERRILQAEQLGISPVLLDPEVMHELRISVFQAALAMTDGDLQQAVAAQRRARDFCSAHGLDREAVINELVVGGFELQGGDPGRAIESFTRARERAELAGLSELAVLAQLAVGASELVRGQVDEAIVAYAEAGRLGAELGTIVLTIEAQRMCGQLLVSQGRPGDAATAFARALATAKGITDPGLTSAPEAARALAELCREHGLVEQATALENMAASDGSELA
jgi:tetratricopeptide (TPR) repeat protein